jgi:hypothetical protein
MPFVFVHKYIKGYAFDHDKVAKAFNCEPYSKEAYHVLHIISKKYRQSYIAAATGRPPEDSSDSLKIILVLASGDDYEELKNRELNPGSKTPQRLL